MTSVGGVIQSPNYPKDYGANFDCVYYIRAPDSSKRIRLAFTTFIIETMVDFLIVSDGPTPDDPLNSVNMNGYFLDPVLTSSGHQMTVQFRSSGVNRNIPPGSVPSFQAVYTVVD